jgi:hypothetical protein
VFAAIALAKPTKQIANLNGEKEVSPEGEKGVGDPDGRGRAVITLNMRAERLCFNLSWSGIGAPSMAHIHDGTKDEAGPVVHPLFMTGDEAAEGDQDLPDTLNGVKGCFDVPRDDLRHLKQDPSGHYVNIHNDEYPGGAIRGQLRNK